MYQSNGFFAYSSFEYTKGVHLFNYKNPTNLNEKFEKYVFDLSLSKNILAIKYDFSMHLQYSKYKLFSINQISIGGPYSVRGYKKEGLIGNNGHYYRNEFSYTTSEDLFGLIKPTYYLGIDGGWIKDEEDSRSGTILGEFIGLKLNYDSFDYDMYYSKPLKKSDVKEHENFLGFQLSYKFW